MSRYFSETQRYRLLMDDIESGAADFDDLDEAYENYQDGIDARAEMERERQMCDGYEA